MWQDKWRTLRVRAATLPLGLIAPLMLAGLSGALAYWIAQSYLQQAERRIAQRHAAAHAVRSVIVAARPAAAGAQLEPAALARRAMPVQYLPRAAFEPDAAPGLYGRRLARALEAGEVLTPASLADPDSEPLSARFKPGERALTIAVDDTNSHASLVQPGDRIDLLWVTDSTLAGGDLAARPLLQAVQVLATGRTLRLQPASAESAQSAEAALREYTTLTLRVGSSHAARIALAERAGELLVVLRSTDDVQVVPADSLTVAGLLGSPAHGASGARPSRPQIAGWVGGRGGSAVAQVWSVGSAGTQVRP